MESTLLVPYDPTWPEQFEATAHELRTVGDPQWVIEHIGSTAIPGLTAKPIIDVAVRTTVRGDLERHRRALERQGWFAGSGVRTHPVLVRERDGARSHIAHFFAASDWALVHQRLFRDWLLNHPLDVDRYAAVKRDAASAAAAGRSSYNSAKTAFVQEIVDRARRAHGHDVVPVSDK